MCRGFLLLSVLALAACDRSPTESLPAEPIESLFLRLWNFETHRRDGTRTLDGWYDQLAGVVSDQRVYGPMGIPISGTTENSHSEVYSNETGQTYWVRTQAPSGATDAGDLIGTSVELWHRYGFRKTSPDAYIRFEITSVLFDALDGNPASPTLNDCPWFSFGQHPSLCGQTMQASVDYFLELFFPTTVPTNNSEPCHVSPPWLYDCLWRIAGAARIYGWRAAWDYDVWTRHDSDVPLWNESDFHFDPAVGGDFTAARLQLKDRLVIDVPLDVLDVGTEVYLYAQLSAEALNYRQGESHLSAYFRDPASINGAQLTYSGLVPIPALPRPENLRTGPACTPGVSPGGTVQFAQPAFTAPEVLRRGHVLVSRSGGSSGAVSALVTSSGGTATPGVDYRPVSTYVLFADGEEGERMLEIPLLNDDEEEPDETIELTLSVGDGCATIGSPARATLTILDDDAPAPPDNTFSIGGTVSGLVGSGLVLRLNLGGTVTPGNGPFVFATRTVDGVPYTVVVETQPSEPGQVCSVANGSGRVSGADVTDIEVTCAPPATHGGLDPGFGSGGKVTAGLPEGARRIALQPDGRIVAVGGRTLARYLPDGALDPDFGSGGQVSVRLNVMSDEVRGVAIQPDGRIVVAGHGRTGVNSPTDFDIGVARFLPDGTPDTSFGDQGRVIIDFAGESDTAEEVLVQPDGGIVVAGSARNRTPDGILNADYAVLRLTTTGEADPGFMQGGKVMTDIAGQTDLPAAALLQPDGKIVVGGRVGRSGGDSPDMALVRYNPDGTLDAGFGAGGIVRIETRDVWDEVQGLALQPDGKLLAVGNQNIQRQGSPFTFKVVRFHPDGRIDTAFGSDGVVTAIPFSTHDDFGQAVALQADGKIVVVGLASRVREPDLAIARLAADGTIDTSFGTDGMMKVDFFGGHDQANAVVIQPDGAIIAAGSAVNGTNTGLGMVRVRP